MELDNKKIEFGGDFSDQQIDELHEHYQKLWKQLKTLEYTTDKQQMEVLYQEPDNTQNYEAGTFTLQIRHPNDQFDFDEYAIIVNNRTTFADSEEEVVLQLAKFDSFEDLSNMAMRRAQQWIDSVKK